MRRIALVSLTMLSSCGYHTWWNPPFSTGSNPNAPITNSENMSRVKGHDVAVTPLTTQPGDIWPGPLPPPTTLQDLERQTPSGVEAPVPGSPLSRSGSSLNAPLPNQPAGRTPSTGGTPGTAPTAPGQTPNDQRIIVPNGNGTSTVIYPDGRIETIPTPK